MELTEARCNIRHRKVGIVATGLRTTGVRVNSKESNFNRDKAKSSMLIDQVTLVSAGVPLLGNNQKEHERIVKKMRLRVAWTQGIHTPDGMVIDDKGKQIALELMEALGVDKLSQDEAIFRVVGPTSGIWDRGVVR